MKVIKASGPGIEDVNGNITIQEESLKHLETEFQTIGNTCKEEKKNETEKYDGAGDEKVSEERIVNDSTVKVKKLKKSFKCQSCDKIFSKPRLLLDHVDWVHDKICRYECKFCHLGLRRKSDKRKHFDVNECNVKTKRDRTRKCSKKSSTNEEKSFDEVVSEVRTLTCFHCDKCFGLFESGKFLVKHIKDKHPLQCDKCGKICYSDNVLQKHIDKFHP